MSAREEIDILIFKYLSDEANLEEIDLLRAWLDSDPENRRVFKLISSYWESSRFELSSNSTNEAYDILKKRKGLKQDLAAHQQSIHHHHTSDNHWKRVLQFAAVIALILSVGLLLYYNIEETKLTTETTIATIVKQNPRGQKSKITLPDGSTVWLNAHSSIQYPEKFEGKLREVNLIGEAFFEIVHNEHKPFIVETKDMNISVLGTSFNVNAYPENASAKIALVSGKVKVNNFKNADAPNEVILEPGESIQYNADNGAVTKSLFDVDYATGWKEGMFVLKNDSFQSFITKLENWYGVSVSIEGHPSESFIVTGKFQNENMENVLRALQFSRDFDFKIDGKMLTLKFK